MNDDDDFLWDGRGEPDREIAALQSELARHRWSGKLPAAPLPARVPRRRWPLALAASLLAAALLGGVAWWWQRTPSAPATDASAPRYLAEALSGELQSTGAGGPRKGAQLDLVQGDRLVTDAASRARVAIGNIGSIEVEPDTVLRVDRPGPATAGAEHLLYLERGALTASIFAAPRLFQVGTPSGLAVDLGCVYTARVQDDGTTRLSVLTGRVSFETPARRVTVPRGASTTAVPGRGPGTPTWDAAPETWRANVARLDALAASGASDLQAALAPVLSTDRADDSLTLWHLLAWAALPRDARAAVLSRLAQLAPAPAGCDPQACLALQPSALASWRSALDW